MPEKELQELLLPKRLNQCSGLTKVNVLGYVKDMEVAKTLSITVIIKLNVELSIQISKVITLKLHGKLF